MNDEYMNEQWFNEYKSLGGKENLETYKLIRKNFEKITLAAFTGMTENVSNEYEDLSRKEAMALFKKWLKENFPNEKAAKIFKSVNNITPYT